MSDLIDRQKAITAICEDGTWLERQGCTEITMCERKQRDADILSELPTIDAVPVVRCQDCRWYDKKYPNGTVFFNYFFCKYYRTFQPPHHFCALGIRGSEDDT